MVPIETFNAHSRTISQLRKAILRNQKFLPAQSSTWHNKPNLLNAAYGK